MTKEEILRRHYFDYYRPTFLGDERTNQVVDMAFTIKEEIEAIYKAMDSYAQQESIAFAEWMDINAVRAGKHEWTCRSNNYKNKYTTEQLYQLYKQQKA